MRSFSQFRPAPSNVLCIVLSCYCVAQGAQMAAARESPAQNSPTTAQQYGGSQSDSTDPQNPGFSPDFYADTNRAEPHQVAFFYSGVARKGYRLEFGDGGSELMTFRYPTDCFPRTPGKRTKCPNYWAFHTYVSPGAYVSKIKDLSGRTVGTITIQVQ